MYAVTKLVVSAFENLEEVPPILFRSSCPNCGGTISSKRLALGVPCEKCLKLKDEEIVSARKNMSRLEFLRFIWKHTDKSRGDGFKRILELEEKAEELNDLSLKISGNKLWSSQRTWAKRLIKGISFSITAPTGLGKTYFGVLASIYYAMNKKKVLFVVPTSALVTHTLKRFEDALKKLKVKLVVVGYHSKMRTKNKKKFKSVIENGKFNILIVTSRYLSTNFKLLNKYKFDLVFVDDVDALLKSSENIDRVLYLVGFKKEHIKKALNLVKKKQNFMYMRSNTRKKLAEETAKFKAELAEYKKKRKVGQIIIASATGAARGLRVKILRELLDFTVGSVRGGLRNIVDSYYLIEPNERDVVPRLVERLGKGGIIFVHRVKPKLINRIKHKLEAKGIRVGDATKPVNIDKLIEDFAEGKIDVLIGAASYYGKLARGLDIPQTIRYAIFVGVPHFKFPLEVTEKTHPIKGYILLNELVGYIEDKPLQTKVFRLISSFRRKFMKLKSTTRQKVVDAIQRGEPLPSKRLEAIRTLCLDILNTVKELLNNPEIVKKLKSSPFVDIREINGRLYIHIPDAKTYIQGSGRTSRLYAGGITKGLAVIVTRRKKLLDALIRRSHWYMEHPEWIDFKKLDLDALIQEIDEDRQRLKDILSGKIPKEFREFTRTALMLVESPTKAKTIARFFGRPARRLINGFLVYEVSSGDYILNIMATRGHTYDLVLADVDVSDFDAMKDFFDVNNNLYGVKIIRNSDPKYVPEYDVLGICRTCGKRFTGNYRVCPRCGSTDIISQADILDAIRDVANEVDLVFIATDPDSEGEKIGFDVALVLMPYVETIRRIEYHAVTLPELRKALQNPRPIDLNRVKAQLVRRIVDRWVGFALSHLLWKSKRIKKKFFSYSAGRVQTPVLGWIIERFEEYRKKKTNIFFITLSNGYIVGLEQGDIPKEEWMKLKGSKVKVRILDEREEIVNPLPPYTTADFLKDISAQLKMSAMTAMKILQELFESGLITYHRTDSTRVSPEGINIAKEYIKNTFGNLDLFTPRNWSKSSEEGAHECIRPTMPLPAEILVRMLQTGELVLPIRFTKRHYAVYRQIFRRFIASQMPPAKIKRGKVELTFSNGVKHTIEGILAIVEPGFMSVYPFNTLPKFDDSLTVVDVKKTRISKVTLYTESDIVNRMREEGIGRPSTYAIIIDILYKRRYIKASPYRQKIFPLKRGVTIYSILTSKILEYAKKLEKKDKNLAESLRRFITVEGTRELESEMDLVERGKEDYQTVLRKVHKTLEGVIKDLDKYYMRDLLPAIEHQINNRKNNNTKH